MKFGWLGWVGGIPLRMGRNEADAVRSARPEGEKCRYLMEEGSRKKMII